MSVVSFFDLVFSMIQLTRFSGAIDTPMHRANLARVPKDFPAPTIVGKAKEVADVTVFLLSEKSAFVNGAAWSVDGGAAL